MKKLAFESELEVTAPRKPRLTWSREPDERGLAGVCQSPRGMVLKANGANVASVSPHCVGFRRYAGWNWCARCDELGIQLRNSLVNPISVKVYKTKEAAQAECAEYVRGCLERAPAKASEK
jgi:hypothetical protein